MFSLFIFTLLIINFFDEEELKEETKVYFEELKINPNYDEKDKMLLFPFLNENDVQKIIEERKNGYFKNIYDFKKRTKIFLPDSIFERHFEFEFKKRRISLFSYWEKDFRVISKFNFYQNKNSINFLWSRRFGDYEIMRFSYSFTHRNFKFIIGDYFINKGCGLIYGISSIFYDFSKNFPEIPESKYVSSSSFNRGLRGFYAYYRYFFIYFSSRKFQAKIDSGVINSYYEGSDSFREEKLGGGFCFKNKVSSFSLLLERNFISKKTKFIKEKGSYQASLDFSLTNKNFALNLEYLPLNNSFFAKFSSFKNGFIFYRISEKNYDLHSSYVSQTDHARDETGFSVFGETRFSFLKTMGYTLIYRKISEKGYSYKLYYAIDFKSLKNAFLKFDYKNTSSSYKRERFGVSLRYNILTMKLNHVIADNGADLSYGNAIIASLNFGFLKFSCGVFNTQDYNSRIYFYTSTFFPYYELFPFYGNGSITSLSVNVKIKELKVYSGIHEIKGEENKVYIQVGFKFKNEKIL